MTIDEARTLLAYNEWAHERVWGCIMALTDEQFVEDNDYSFGSIRNHMVHVMGVDNRWFARIGGGDPSWRPDPAQFPTREAVRAEWEQRAAANKAILDSLDEASLNAPVPVKITSRNIDTQVRTSDILAHVVNHGTDHRAQVLALLYRLGAPTVEQDMILFTTES